jgi:hypothetical protein
MAEHMLTTDDNPYNPFTEYEEWYQWDTSKGYHTASYLARVVRYSDELSEPDQDLAIQQGIDEIVELNLSGRHKKVARPS